MKGGNFKRSHIIFHLFIFWKREAQRDSKQISDCQGLGTKEMPSWKQNWSVS